MQEFRIEPRNVALVIAGNDGFVILKSSPGLRREIEKILSQGLDEVMTGTRASLDVTKGFFLELSIRVEILTGPIIKHFLTMLVNLNRNSARDAHVEINFLFLDSLAFEDFHHRQHLRDNDFISLSSSFSREDIQGALLKSAPGLL